MLELVFAAAWANVCAWRGHMLMLYFALRPRCVIWLYMFIIQCREAAVQVTFVCVCVCVCVVCVCVCDLLDVLHSRRRY